MEPINSNSVNHKLQNAFIVAWVLGCLFYFMEYVARSAPAVMLKELGIHFHVGNLAVSSILGTYYYTYSVTSLIAGVALDRFGGKYTIAIGCIILAAGCLTFSLPHELAGDAGRLLQGAGSAFAFTGCVYLASHGFQARYIATAIGFTQCIGMLGGSAGQFVVGPLIQAGLSSTEFWIYTGVICTVISILLCLITPLEKGAFLQNAAKNSILAPYGIVFRNPQSYLSGLISGLLFAPTTIFAMTWGVAFLQQDRGFSYHDAVFSCAMVPMGWVIGCPLVGWISDRMGKRKPVLAVSILLMFLSYLQLIFLPDAIPVIATMLIFGTASGAAMIPYSIIKEVNPDDVKGSATGAQNFITFSVTALIGPIFASQFGKTLGVGTDAAIHFQTAGIFFLAVILIALLLSFMVRETGHAVKVQKVH